MVMSAILKDIRAAFGDVEATPYTVVVQRGGYEERVYPARRWACTTMSGPSRHALVTPMFRRLFCYISGRNEPNIRIDMTTPVTTLVELNTKEQKNTKRTCFQQEDKEEELQNTLCNNQNGTSSSSSCPNSCPSTCPTSTISSSSSSASATSSSLPIYTMGFLVPASHQDNPPASSDKNIFIEDRPKMVVLASRFSGYMNDEVVSRELAALREAIKSNGDDAGVDFTRYYVAGYDPPFKLLGRRNEIWVVKKVEEKQNGCGDCGGCGDVAVMSNGCVVKDDVELVSENGNDVGCGGCGDVPVVSNGCVVKDDVELVSENGNDEVMLS